MRYWDSNSRPLGQESPPLTTRPGLPLINMSHFISILIFICLLHYAMEICSLEQVPNWWHMCEDKNCRNGILNYAKLLTSQITISSRNYFSLFLLLPFLSLSLSLSHALWITFCLFVFYILVILATMMLTSITLIRYVFLWYFCWYFTINVPIQIDF